MNKKNVQTDSTKKLQRAWNAYKSESGSSQAKAAKALGMNQSAFSQYIRGEIGTNTDFLAKFEKLTNTQVGIEAKAELFSYPLHITHTLSGLTPVKAKILVESVVSSANTFGVLVDMPSSFTRGSVLVADTTDEIREGDLVVLTKQGTATVGNIRMSDEGWALAVLEWGTTTYEILNKNSKVARVTSSFYPQVSGRKVDLGHQ